MNARLWYRLAAFLVMVPILLFMGQATPSTAAGIMLVDEPALIGGTVSSSVNAAGWRGEYYPNIFLGGEPTIVRTDSAIEFNWGSGSPAAGLPADYFSVRWTADVYFDAGRYRFTAEADDGVRLFVDRDILIDQWREQSVRQYSADVQLAAGVYTVRMEYYDLTRDAIARLRWQRQDSTAGWRSEYFANPVLAGAPALVRNDPQIDFDWGYGSPDSAIQSNGFSARWTREVAMPAGTYRITATCDDGMRIWVDGRLVLDEWYVHAADTHRQDIQLSGGQHFIAVEYFEDRGLATARVAWAPVSESITEWRGEYFNNQWLSGSPLLVRNDAAVNFDWGTGSPDWRLAADHFSVRWTRAYSFVPATYRFTVRSDDGVRLYIDDRLVLNEWRDMSRTSFTRDVQVDGGTHTVRLEYFENAGAAAVQLGWEPVQPGVWVGNIITQVPPAPSYSWIKVYRLEPNGTWTDINPHGYGSIEPSGWLKIEGLWVDYMRYGNDGHPYRVEQWVDGRLTRSVGDTSRGEAPFRVYVARDSVTPWQVAR